MGTVLDFSKASSSSATRGGTWPGRLHRDRAKAFARKAYVARAVDLTLAGLALLYVDISATAQAGNAWLQSAVGQTTASNDVYQQFGEMQALTSGMMASVALATLALARAIIAAPVAAYGDLFLARDLYPERHNPLDWLWDYAIASLIGTGVIGAGGFAIGVLAHANPASWWIWAFAIGAIGIVARNVLGPTVTGACTISVTPLGVGPLRDRLLALAERAGTTISRCDVVGQHRDRGGEANASTIGFGRSRRILITETLVDGRYTVDEVGAIFAHELGHLAHGDGRIALMLDVSILGAGLAFAEWVRVCFGAGNDGSVVGLIGGMAPLILAIGLFRVATTPFRHACLRALERRADAFAVSLIGDPSPWIAILRRLAEENLADVDPHPCIEWWCYSHPSFRRRIRAASSRHHI